MTTDLNTNSAALPNDLNGYIRSSGLCAAMAQYLGCDPCNLPDQRKLLAAMQSARIPAVQHPTTKIWLVNPADVPRISERYRPTRLSANAEPRALADAAA